MSALCFLPPSPHSHINSQYAEQQKAKFICFKQSYSRDGSDSFQAIHQFNFLFFKTLPSHIALLSEKLQLVSTSHSDDLLGKVGKA